MPERHALALHRVDTHRRRVEQDIDEMIGEQVDLIDVENAAMRRREQPWLKRAPPLAQSTLEIESAQHTILGGPQRQINERYGHFDNLASLRVYPGGIRAAMRTFAPGRIRIAVK